MRCLICTSTDIILPVVSVRSTDTDPTHEICATAAAAAVGCVLVDHADLMAPTHGNMSYEYVDR